MVGAWVFGIENICYRMAYVLAWHLAADWATRNYPTPTGETTIRRSVNGETGYKSHGRATHIALWFFSFAQLVGTFLMMVDTPNAVRNAMFVMTPVQVSAFLATLVRKGYFESHTSFMVYLMVLFPIFYYHPWCSVEVLFVLAVTICRFRFRVNKYVMWLAAGLAYAYLMGDLEAATGVSAFTPPVLPAMAWKRMQIASTLGSWIEALLGVKISFRTPSHDFNALYSSFTPASF